MTRLRHLAVAIGLFFLGAAAQARTIQISVLVDSDINRATGCSFAGFDGAEKMITATVDIGTSAAVTAITEQDCVGGTFGAVKIESNGGWSAPFVADGSSSLEFSAPISIIGSPLNRVRLGFVYRSGPITQLIATNPDGSDILFPPHTGRRRAARPADGTHNIRLDGDVSDWNGIAPIATGDGILARVFVYEGSSDLFFRFDAMLAETVVEPPSANSDSYSVRRGRTLSVAAPGVLANDNDPQGLPLSANLTSQPTHGTVTLNADGSFTYTHNGDAAVSDQFTYVASSTSASSASATVLITIIADQPPVANGDAYTITEGGTLNVAAPGLFTNDTDPDTPSSGWSVTVVTPPAHGALTLGTSGAFTYIHDGSETISDSFVYAINDGFTSSSATVTITVTPVNDPPVANNDTYTTNEDAALTIAAPGVLGNDSDPDGPALSASVVTNPANGAVVLNANGSFTYTPNANFNGTDSFTYRASDGSLSSVATVTITVTPVNDVPSFSSGGDVTVLEDSGAHSQPWATAISAGPNEATQTINFIVSNNNSSLFSVAPAISPAGVLTFTPAANANGSATVSVQIHDNGGTANGGVDTSATQTFTITVSAVNDPPTFTVGSGVAVLEDSGAYSAAQVSAISPGPADESGQTVSFSATNNNNALFSGQPAISPAGVLTFTPAANAYGTATVSVTATDNGTPNASSAAQTFTITVSPVNDAPSFTAGANVTVNEDSGAYSQPWATAISAGPNEATQTVNFIVSNNNNALFSVAPAISPAGVLTFTPAANANGSATASVQIHDDGGTANGGVDTSATQTLTITVTPVNDAPVVNAGPLTPSYAENGAPVAAAPALTVTDIDSANLTGATVSIPANFASGQDVLTLPAPVGAVTGSYNAVTGVLTLSGTDTIANYQSALRSVTYSNTSDNPSTAPRTLSWVATDGTTPSAPSTSTLNVIASNDAPGLAAGGTLNYTENQAAAAIDNTITITDVDSPTMAGATAQITSGYLTGEDVLSFVNTANITGSFNATTGRLTLSGTDTLANYQVALRNVRYNNTSDSPSTTARTVSWQVNDGGAVANLSNFAISTINITPVDDAPVVNTGNPSTVYTENGPPVTAAPGLTVTDVDSLSLTGATIAIMTNFVTGQDVLSLPAPVGAIAGAYNPATGMLTLTGTDSVANYQLALRSVTYSNTSDNPSTASRTLAWIATDGTTPSAPSTSTINIIPVNDPPTLAAGGLLFYTENQALAPIDTNITIIDIDSPTMAGATAQITGGYVIGEDVLSFVNTASITGTFNAATGTITLSGIDTLANYQTALRNVRYNNTSDNPSIAARTVTWQVNDGGAVANLSNTTTSLIVVTPVNDAPTVTPSANLTYTEGQGAVILDAGVTVTDPDGTDITGATVQISGNYVTDQDFLAFTDTPPILGSFNAGTGTLTLTGTDTKANYQAALRTITYLNISNAPSTAQRTVTWNATDTSAATGAGLTSKINVISVNTPPIVNTFNTLDYLENQPATAIEPGLGLFDVDSASLSGATVSLTTNFVSGQDVLSFTPNGTITGSYNGATGVLTLGGTDSVVNYQSVLQSVSYFNSSDNPSMPSRTVVWVVTDGIDSSTPQFSTINVTATNDTPAITVAPSASYTENASPVTLGPALTVTDPDSTTLASATVEITANFNPSQDVLNATPMGPIVVAYNFGTGVLTLTGSDTVANYQTVLRSITYENTDEDPTSPPRTISWTVNDGTGDGVTSSSITVIPINDPPVVTAGGTLSYTENQAPQLIDNTITVADVDNANLTGATVSITSNFQNGADVLSFATMGPISGSYNAATGVMTLSGTDTVANYQAALRTVTYHNTSDNPSTSPRTITWVVTDGTTPSAPVTSSVNVNAVNDSPVLTVGGTLNYTEDQPAQPLNATLTLTDPDSNINGASVSITANLVITEDNLSFSPSGNVTGSYDTNTGVLTFSGSDTPATYQMVLRSVSYTNASQNPSTAPRSVSWTATDGIAPPATATSTINVISVNDAPVVTAGGTLGYTENQGATIIDGGVTVTDVDNVALTGATISISSNFQSGADQLIFVNQGGITGSYNAGTGVLTLTGTAALSTYETALRTVRYQNTSDNPTSSPRTISWVITDGVTPSTPATSTINVTPVNDAPALTPGATTGAFVENAGPVVVASQLGVSDVDNTTLQSATVTILNLFDGAAEALAANTAGTSIIAAPYDSVNGVLALSGSDTIANYQTVLRTVTYNNTSDNPTAVNRAIQFIVNDGALPSNFVNKSVSVTALNDAPVVTAGGTLNYTEDDAPRVIDNSITVTDPDSADATGATVSIAANFQNGADVLSFSTIGPITGIYNSGTGVLSLSGTDTPANYQAALRTVTYNNTSQAPTSAPRTISWVVTDGTTPSSPATSTINVTAVNDAPVVTPTGTPLNYTENDAATAIQPLITVTDADTANLTGGTVRLTTNYVNGQDVLSYTTALGITGTFNATNGTLTLTGTTTVANYQTALRNVKYNNTSETPSEAPRTVEWQVNDGQAQNNLSVVQTSTINVTAVNDAPIVNPETFEMLGNTELRVDMPAGTTPNTTETTAGVSSVKGVLDNDSDPEGDPIAVTAITGCGDATAPFDCTIAGAVIHVEATGEFSFTPAPGATTGSFTYSVTDVPSAGTPQTATGTVSFTVFDMIWYVKQGSAGNGTSINPLGSFTSINNAGDSDGPGDYIFVQNSGALASDIYLEANQHLLGEGVGLSINRNLNGNGSPTVLVPAGTKPAITSATMTITGGPIPPSEIRGLSLASTAGSAIRIDLSGAPAGSAALTISDNSITGATSFGIFIRHFSNSLTLSLAFHDNIMMAGSPALLISSNGPALFITAFHDNVVTGTAGGGIDINSSLGTVVFDQIPGGAIQPVPGGTTVIGSAGDRVGSEGLGLSNVEGTLDFANVASGTIGAGDLDIFTDSGSALSVVAGGAGFTLNVTNNAGTLLSNAGAAASINNANVNLQLNSLTSTNSTDVGVSLTNVTGTFSAPSGSSITNASGTDFLISGGTANVTYGGTITDDVGQLVNIANTTGGTKTFSGAITDGDDGDGQGISLTNNTGATIRFNGGLVLSTGGNNAFTATGGGTVEVCDENPCNAAATGALINKITTTTGTALNVANTTIGANKLEFRSISSNGAPSGIILDNTGTSGGLTVTGNSSGFCGGQTTGTPPTISQAPNTSDCTGGTIQNSTGPGILLTSTSNVSFTRMWILNGGDDGISGTTVTGFTLASCLVDNNGNAVGEEGLDFDNLYGTSSITNSTIRLSHENNVEVRNTSNDASQATLTVTGCQISNASAKTQSDDGVLYQMTGIANGSINVSDSVLTANRGDHLQANSANNTTLNVVFRNNNLIGGHATALGQTIVVNSTVLTGTASVTYDIDGNKINGAILSAITVNLGVPSAATSTFTGKVRNNIIGTTGVIRSCSEQAHGIAVDAHGKGTHTVSVTGNTMRQCKDRGINVTVNDSPSISNGEGNPGGNLFLTVQSNTVLEGGPINPPGFPADGTGSREAFNLIAGSTASDTPFICAQIGGAGVLANNFNRGTEAIATGLSDIRIKKQTTAVIQIRLPGYAGSVTDASAFVAGLNTSSEDGSSTAAASATSSGSGGGGFQGGAACATPP